MTGRHDADLAAGAMAELRLSVVIAAAATSGFVNTANVASLTSPALELGVADDTSATGQVPVSPAANIPSTGAESGRLLSLAVVVLGAGWMLLGATRRRRRTV